MNDLFAKAVAIEDSDPETALNLYEQIISKEKHAASHINAGRQSVTKNGDWQKPNPIIAKQLKLIPSTL